MPLSLCPFAHSAPCHDPSAMTSHEQLVGGATGQASETPYTIPPPSQHTPPTPSLLSDPRPLSPTVADLPPPPPHHRSSHPSAAGAWRACRRRVPDRMGRCSGWRSRRGPWTPLAPRQCTWPPRPETPLCARHTSSACLVGLWGLGRSAVLDRDWGELGRWVLPEGVA